MQDHPDKTTQLAAVPPGPPILGEAAMFCTACGAKNTTDANFCKQCGHKMARSGPLKISEEDFALPASAEERVRMLLLSAYTKYEAGDLEAAITTCMDALEIKPGSTDVHSLMSTLYEKQGNIERAIAERERVLELNPGSIADREKLDELRDGKRSTTRVKINSTHRTPGPVLFDSPSGQAMLAVGVMIVVMIVGIAAVWASRSRAGAPEPTSKNTAQIAPLNLSAGTQFTPTNNGSNSGAPNNMVASNPAGTVPVGQGAPGSWTVPNGYSGQPISQQSEPRRGQLPTFNTREVGPAAVSPPPDREQSNSTRWVGGGRAGNDRGNSSAGGTVHLLDTGETPPANAGTGAARGGPSGPNGFGNAGNGTAPGSQGRIEIIVSPGSGGATSGSTGGARTAANDTSGSTMDSQDARRKAHDLQTRSQYKRAITEYIKALDGAGDEAAYIHQQMALCYQRVDEPENAIAQYNSAIGAYKLQIAGGRNTDSAARGIKACEAGIKACQ